MTQQHLGRSLIGMVGALLLAACNGTVELRTGSAGSGGSTETGGVGGLAPVGSLGGVGGLAPVGSLGGVGGLAPVGSLGGVGGLAPVGSLGGVGGLAPLGGGGGALGGTDPVDIGPQPQHGVLAYDANADALGRAIFIHSFESNGCTERLTDPAVQAKQAAFSADGKQLAYAALVDGFYQIHVRDLASGDTQQVTEMPVGASSPAFSPDGSQLAFVTGDPEEFGNRAAGTGSLLLLDLETHDVRVLSDASTLGCCTPAYLSPVYNGSREILVGTGMSLVGIDTETGAVRDLVPITGRIPNPQDPSPAPDGKRYVFSDYCGRLGLYIARIDGSTGDTCGAALPIPTTQTVVSADWGAQGFIAAEIHDQGHGVLLIDDVDFKIATLDVRTARNPTWAPAGANVNITCK